MLKHVSLAAVFVLSAVPAAAQTTSSATDSNALDPKRRVCERVEVTGSRVKARKVCMSAEQWEAKRQSDREDLERAQRNTDIPRSN